MECFCCKDSCIRHGAVGNGKYVVCASYIGIKSGSVVLEGKVNSKELHETLSQVMLMYELSLSEWT